MKTSLRERYKQADLEGLALRQVYRKAQSHLITLSTTEADGVKKKISDGDISGLDSCTIATSSEYTELLQSLSADKFHIAEKVLPIRGVCVEEV